MNVSILQKNRGKEKMLHAGLIFLGPSLDSFVVMMHTGATLRNLTLKNALLYSLIYALISLGVFLCGYGVSVFFDGILSDGRVQIGAASMILLAVGLFVLIKSARHSEFVEKLDRDFDWRKLCRLALITNIDTFFVGAGFLLLGVPLGPAVVQAFVISFLTAFISLETGYYNGAGFERTVGMSGGAMMIVFSLYFMMTYVLR